MKIAAIWMGVSLAVTTLPAGGVQTENLWRTEQKTAAEVQEGVQILWEEAQPGELAAAEGTRLEEDAAAGTRPETAEEAAAGQVPPEEPRARVQVVTGGQTQEASAPAGPEIQAPSAVLMEASTGQVIYEKNADQQRSPASITKIMTLILIFDAIDSGKIKMSDEVVTSAHAKSMGGSQVFLEGTDIIGINQKTFVLWIEGILITMDSPNTIVSIQVRQLIEQGFAGAVPIFRTHIPRSIKVAEAVLYHKTICEFMPNNPAALAYERFVDELLENEQREVQAVGY